MNFCVFKLLSERPVRFWIIFLQFNIWLFIYFIKKNFFLEFSKKWEIYYKKTITTILVFYFYLQCCVIYTKIIPFILLHNLFFLLKCMCDSRIKIPKSPFDPCSLPHHFNTCVFKICVTSYVIYHVLVNFLTAVNQPEQSSWQSHE